MICEILVFGALIIIGLMLLKGKCSFLIAGFNTMSKEEKENYDEKALCKCIGKFILLISFCLLTKILGMYFNIHALEKLGNSLPPIITIFLLLYLNTKKKFRIQK